MFYSLKEGFSGLLRAKVSTIISTSVISASLFIICFFLIFVLNTKIIVDSIKNRIQLEIFIDNSYDTNKTDLLKNRLIVLEGVDSINYISKEKAVELFKKQFDEDIFEILDENPLPASFQIILTKHYQSSNKAGQLINKIQKIEGVDEVEFRKDILIILEKYLKIFYISILIIGGLLIIGSIFLVSNTIKLVIISKISIIETMKLVGATKGFIRRPFIFEGIIQGIISSSISVLILWAILKIINLEIPGILIVNNYIFCIIYLLGILFGFLGSLFAIQRFLKF